MDHSGYPALRRSAGRTGEAGERSFRRPEPGHRHDEPGRTTSRRRIRPRQGIAEISHAAASRRKTRGCLTTTKEKGIVKLMAHQIQGVEIARREPRYAFFYEPGLGKTALVLAIVAEQGGKTVVVCPKSI